MLVILICLKIACSIVGHLATHCDSAVRHAARIEGNSFVVRDVRLRTADGEVDHAGIVVRDGRIVAVGVGTKAAGLPMVQGKGRRVVCTTAGRSEPLRSGMDADFAIVDDERVIRLFRKGVEVPVASRRDGRLVRPTDLVRRAVVLQVRAWINEVRS
jgi:hypothetical protein